MFKVNILKLMYNHSPMNFYTFDKDTTIIKSINNTSLGYSFDKIFDNNDIASVWREIKLCKKWSTILIFLFLITLLYGVIFPNFSRFVNYEWYVNAIIILFIFGIVCQIITKLCTLIFEKRLKKIFGGFKKTIFIPPAKIDKDYYSRFKTELIKALVIILVIVACFSIGSPLKKAQNLIESGKYNEVISLTTIGSKVFPIAQEWYSLRGYARFQTGDYEGAINDYDKAYKLGADGLNIMNFDNKIFIKYYLNEYDSALEDFNTEIKNAGSEDEKDQFLWDKAQFLYYIKHYDEALSLYTELIGKAEEDRIYLLKDRLYLERAQVFNALGQNELAQDDIANSGVSPDEISEHPIPQPTLMLNNF